MLDYYESEMEFSGDVCVLSVSGETDMYTAPRFKRDLDEAMAVVPGDVVLDLSDLDMIESTALGILIAALACMSDERRSLVLVIKRRHVLRVFAITGLRSAFSIVSTRAEALASVAAGQWSRQAA